MFRAIPQSLVGTIVPALLHHTVDLMIIVFIPRHYSLPQVWCAGLAARDLRAVRALHVLLPELPDDRRQQELVQLWNDIHYRMDVWRLGVVVLTNLRS